MRLAIVAVVTTGQGLSEHARGLLRRCGFGVTEHRSIGETAAAFLHGPAPDYVVLMLGEDQRQGMPALGPLLDAIQPPLTPSRVVAVCPSRLHNSRPEIADAKTRGMQVFSAERFSVRKLARFLMELRGVDGARCCPSASEQPLEERRTPSVR